jgi:sugar phosphate isomerase/epimerase
MSELNVALQVYTIREHLKDRAGFTDAMQKVSEIGYRNVELAGVGDVSLEDQRKVCDDNGLSIVATHTGYGEYKDNLSGVVDKHKLLGAPFAGIGGLPGDLRNGEGYKQAADEMTAWAETLGEAGLRFVYHNHDQEFQKYDGTLAMDVIFSDANPNVCSELDLYWVQHGGANPVSWIKKLAGRVPLIHAKDYAIIDKQPTFAEVGEGNLEWPAIIDAAKEAGSEWFIVEEDRCTRPCMEAIAISFRNMQAMGLC